MLKDTPTPDGEPYIPEGAIVDSLAALSGVTDAVFMPWIEDRISLIWLESVDDRLGMTRFEEGSAELNRQRRLRLDPGEVTYRLTPCTAREKKRFIDTHLFTNLFMLLV